MNSKRDLLTGLFYCRTNYMLPNGDVELVQQQRIEYPTEAERKASIEYILEKAYPKG